MSEEGKKKMGTVGGRPVPLPEPQPPVDVIKTPKPKMKKKFSKEHGKMIDILEETEFDLRKATLPGNYGVLSAGRWEIIDVEKKKEERVFPTKSFTLIFAEIIRATFKSGNAVSATIKEVVPSKPIYATDGTTQIPKLALYVNNYNVDSPAGNTNYGILVGDGTQSSPWSMGNPRIDLNYQATVVQNVAEFADRFEVYVERIIANNTGADINLTEIGLIGTATSTSNPILMIYDPISPAYTLPNGSSRLFRLKIVLPK